MAGNPHPQQPAPHLLVTGFPTPGSKVQKAYQDLWLAQNGTDEQKKKLGNPAKLPHPWEPATCTDRVLRWDLWVWLDQVAAWVNAQYAWEAGGAGFIPDCWPQHPHLVHELAVLADQRRRAGLALTSDTLENWHRYVLPGFFERVRQRIKQSCDGEHQPWPSRSRYARYTGDQATQARLQAFNADQAALAPTEPQIPSRPRLTVVDGATIDTTTGEVW